MKLYSNLYSYRARRCVAVVRQLGLPVEIVEVDLGKGAHHAPAFAALNPNRKVPVLVDGDFTLWESLAITQYLADQRPGTLLPASPAGRADVTRWQTWTAVHFNAATDVFLHENLVKSFFGLGLADAARVDAARPAVIAAYDLLEAHLAGREFLTGPLPSLADLTLYPTIEMAASIGLPSLEQHPRLAAWAARTSALPGFSAA